MVRALRERRHWTQAELAGHLGLSQSRLSEIERGAGSFTAEQLLLIVQLFNVELTDFVPSKRSGEADLQNALARLGATQLQESPDVIPSAHLSEVNNVVREALVTASPRLLTALGPVLVSNADRVSLPKIHSTLAEVGLERRLCWLAENVLVAVNDELETPLEAPWRPRYMRTSMLLRAFVDAQRRRQHSTPDLDDSPPDLLDRSIRSHKTRVQVEASGSKISRRWGIVTSLQPEDFARALRAARAAD